MLITLLNWIYIFLICYVLGAFTLPRVARLIDTKAAPLFNWCDCMVAGLVISTVYAEIFSLFGRIGLLANILLALSCIVFAVLDRQRVLSFLTSDCSINKSVPVRCVFIAIACVLFVLNLMYTAESTFHYDTGLYHAQAIHWIEDYGIIKGLGRLHVRFAYNSAYFPLCALFSMRDLTGGQSLHSVSGFISMIMCLYAVWGWIKAPVSGRSRAISACARFAVIFYFLVCIIELTSPESDYIAIYMIIWIVIRFAEIHESGDEDNRLVAMCLLAVCSFAMVGFKLSSAVIAAVTIWPLVEMIRHKMWKSIGWCAALAALMVLPYVLRNLVICGWPVYPVAILGIFDFPWKFDADTLIRDANEIGDGSRLIATGKDVDRSVAVWIRAWWQEQYFATKMFVLSLLFSVPVMIGEFLDRKNRIIKYIMAILTATIIFYFIKAPAIRYSYGPVLVLPLVVAGYLIAAAYDFYKKSSGEGKRMRGIATVCVAALVALVIEFPTLYGAKELIKFDYEESLGRFSHKDYLIRQVDYPVADVYERDWYGHTVYLPVEGDQCWYYAFPSSPYHECFDYNMPITDDIKDGVIPQSSP